MLVTDLATWASLVQRFGRCNRYGEYAEGGKIFWVDIKVQDGKDEFALPYPASELRTASPRLLKQKAEYKSAREIRPVIRRKDLVDLFDTTPDICGNDLDVSRYVRDSDDTEVQVYWRNVAGEAPPDDEPRSQREELCRVSLAAFADFLQKNRPRVF